jgi:hypothetical protein
MQQTFESFLSLPCFLQKVADLKMTIALVGFGPIRLLETYTCRVAAIALAIK